MRLLAEPTLVAADVFDTISRAKIRVHRHTLGGIRERVLERFGMYGVDHLHTLTKAGWDATERAALLLCYESVVPGQVELRETILSSAGQFCPYCGMDRPTTVDHYIPKDEHPEFSIFPANLVAACGACNTAKGTTWIESGTRQFLHAYFDRFAEDAACLVAEVHWQSCQPMFSFRLEHHRLVPQSLFDVLDSHVRRLHLLRWYSGRSAEEFDDFEPGGERISLEALRELVRTKKVEKLRRKWGPLSWRAALWEAVLRNEAALEYLQRQFED